MKPVRIYAVSIMAVSKTGYVQHMAAVVYTQDPSEVEKIAYERAAKVIANISEYNVTFSTGLVTDELILLAYFSRPKAEEEPTQ
jgi:hypothetical protein